MKGRARQASARRATRNVPIPPELVAMLGERIARFGEDGRLFRSENGSPIRPSTCWPVWAKARALVLTPAQRATPLMRRPYDLRHSGITWRLNSCVPAVQRIHSGAIVRGRLRNLTATQIGGDVRDNPSISSTLSEPS